MGNEAPDHREKATAQVHRSHTVAQSYRYTVASCCLPLVTASVGDRSSSHVIVSAIGTQDTQG
jgi:hypothetical protein